MAVFGFLFIFAGFESNFLSLPLPFKSSSGDIGNFGMIGFGRNSPAKFSIGGGGGGFSFRGITEGLEVAGPSGVTLILLGFAVIGRAF